MMSKERLFWKLMRILSSIELILPIHRLGFKHIV